MSKLDIWDMNDPRNSVYAYKKGGSAPQQPIIAPTAPVEEASVEIEDEDKKKKASTGKSTLKIPLPTATGAGANVSGATGSGLKV